MTKYLFKTITKQGYKVTKAKYDCLTCWNNHGDAIRLICEYFKEDKLVKAMEHINALHDLYGYLPSSLWELREDIWKVVSPKWHELERQAI